MAMLWCLEITKDDVQLLRDALIWLAVKCNEECQEFPRDLAAAKKHQRVHQLITKVEGVSNEG